MKLGIEFSEESSNFWVKYTSPSRKVYDFRTELYNDAITLKNKFSDLIVLFSTGIDSQLILRTFLDAKVNAKYVFLHSEGYNDKEFNRLEECKKFYGIDIEIIKINLDQYKNDWVNKSLYQKPSRMFNYPFELLSSMLPNNIPVVFQGPNEPTLIASGENNSLYYNYYDTMLSRLRDMRTYRPVIDFPFSPESITSYYTDDIIKGFSRSIKYFYKNEITKDNKNLSKLDYYEYFCKPILKGKYFKNEIIWYEKDTGFESFPKWFKHHYQVKETRVTVPYWDLVNFLETTIDETKIYKEWILPKDTPGFISIYT